MSGWPAPLSVRGAERVLRTPASRVLESEEEVQGFLCPGGRGVGWGEMGQFPALSPGSNLFNELDQGKVLSSPLWGGTFTDHMGGSVTESILRALDANVISDPCFLPPLLRQVGSHLCQMEMTELAA